MAPSLGTLDQAFQFIQEFTGFISPGVVAIFLLGMFWKKTSARAAFYAVLISIPLSTAFKFLTPGIPFIDRMGLCFLIIVALMMLVSYMDNKNNDDENDDSIMFKKTVQLYNINFIKEFQIYASDVKNTDCFFNILIINTHICVSNVKNYWKL